MKDKQLPCTICQELTPPIYLREAGPYCIRHWMEVTTPPSEAVKSILPHIPRECMICGEETYPIYYMKRGPICSEHYFYVKMLHEESTESEE